MILLLPKTIGSANDVVVKIFNGEKFLRNLQSEDVIEKTMSNDYKLNLRTP